MPPKENEKKKDKKKDEPVFESKLDRMKRFQEATRKIIEENNNIAIGLAVQAGNVAQIKRLFRRGARMMLANGWTPILTTAQGGHTAAIRCLAALEVEPHEDKTPYMVDSKDKRGFTALHAAASGGHDQCCEVLVKEFGLNPNSVTVYGVTPFLIAARNGSISTMQTLVDLGAKPEAEDKTAFTALHLTAQQGMEECVKLLVSDFGLDVNAITQHGNAPVHLAAQTGEHEVLRLLIEEYKANPNPKNHRGKTPYDLAMDNAREDTALYIQDLIKKRRQEAGASGDQEPGSAAAEEAA
mmetsp:Transcript_14407/g.34074  ORF Transcript_14407/g.34074 Transcript_14407/m.34074 type:complete len:297 (+) Transcript_14407:78-968(+)